MNVEIKWENIDGQAKFNNEIIELSKQYQSDNFKKFSFLISREPNSRHIINLSIDTNNEGEELSLTSNSYCLENSLYLLKNDLKKTLKKYDPSSYQREIERKKKVEENIQLTKARALENEKKKLEEKELKIKAKLANEQKQREKELEKQNEEILKKLEKNRKEEEKQEEIIIQELDKQKKILEDARKIEEENKQRLQEHLHTLKFDVVAEDLEEDNEIQEKIKEEKQKLKDLQSEENECLVIVEEIKALDKKEFDIDEYKPNEPFMLADTWFYHDGDDHLYTTNENNEWVQITTDDIKPYFDASKQNKFYELEARLIEARKRRKLHLKDLIDGEELLKELEENKFKTKKLEKEQKENFKKLKENYDEIAKQTAEETKAQIKPVEIEIAEVHPANEPFLTEFNVYAYHDGEGNYYMVGETGNWAPTSKSNVYSKSKIIDTEIKDEIHKAGDQFQNSKGDTFYFDGQQYYKFVNGDWELTSMAEAIDLDKKKEEEEKHNKKWFKSRKTKALHNTEQVVANNNSTTDTQTQQTVDVSNDQSYAQQQDNTQQESTSNGGQQWTDENGVTWYLDDQGNYYWWDGTNWVLYTYN